jgi:hypothetical protein
VRSCLGGAQEGVRQQLLRAPGCGAKDVGTSIGGWRGR